MPSISEISYSREATVAAFRDYYRFLVSMYLDESNVQEPPEGGWPSIPPNGWKIFDKTDEVIALLRELPYLREETDPYQIHGAPSCHIDGQDLKEWSEPDPDEAEIPAHIVGLTVPSEASPAILLDTELGVIYWRECPGEIRADFQQVEGDPYDWVDDGLIPEDQVEWRVGSGIWAVEDFFKMLKANFQKLNFVPIGPREVQDVWDHRDESEKELQVAIQNIYRKHGWPDMTRFSKENCSAEIKALLEVRAPSLAE